MVKIGIHIKPWWKAVEILNIYSVFIKRNLYSFFFFFKCLLSECLYANPWQVKLKGFIVNRPLVLLIKICVTYFIYIIL